MKTFTHKKTCMWTFIEASVKQPKMEATQTFVDKVNGWTNCDTAVQWNTEQWKETSTWYNVNMRKSMGWVRKAWHRRQHTLWFRWYKVLEQGRVNLLKQKGSQCWPGHESMALLQRGTRGILGCCSVSWLGWWLHEWRHLWKLSIHYT